MNPDDAPQIAENDTELIDPTPSYVWEASEFVHHEKPAGWYVGLVVVVVVLAGILALLQQWVSVGVVAIMGLAVVVYSRKEPRTLQYAIDEHGVSINGKLTAYHLFHSYNVQAEVGWQEIDLEPARRFAPRLTLLADADSLEKIETVLEQHLPRVDRDPDVIERLSRYIKF